MGLGKFRWIFTLTGAKADIVEVLLAFIIVMHLKPHNTGVAVGAFVGLVHVGWSVLAGLGLAQGLADFIAKVHMIKPFITVMKFDLGAAITLVIVTAVVGYAFGYIFALVWGRLYSR